MANFFKRTAFFMIFREPFHSVRHFCVFIFLVLLHLQAARAQTSLFDPSFAIGRGSEDLVSAIHVQTDGRILVGATLNCCEFDECEEYLFRLLSNGEIDPSFGSGTDGQVNRLLAQPDGAVLVAGYFSRLLGVERIGLGRLMPNGVVDPDFNPGDFFSTNGQPFTIALQDDGKILVASFMEDGQSRLLRLFPNGTLDVTFHNTNVLDQLVYSLLVRNNGTIVVGGAFSSANGVPAHGIAVFDSTGQLDTNLQFGLQSAAVFTIVPTPDQKLLVGGILYRQQGSTLLTNMIARLTPELTWDTNFSTAEFSLNQYGSSVKTILLQPDGKMVAGGSFPKVGGYYRRNIVRLKSDGSVDPCFDPGLGLVGDYFGAITVVRQPDGRLLVGGVFDSVDGIKHSNLTRLLSSNDCDVTRMYIQETDPAIYPYYLTHQVFGTSSPGGTNVLQSSTNLVDWIEVGSTTEPLISSDLYLDDYGQPNTQFFRIKKEH
ncbi:MAG: hypothetical protein H7Y43_04005 [Akkermansiaceae bacterium]|nr:hypothetical protein [Verrucomicrobiales bacterium]